MTANDLDLLGQFAREQSQDAFTALVKRHLNLVYSAALRQVRSPQLAEEVSQTVFTTLAGKAAELRPDTILTAWLYEVTRHAAIDVVRREARRQAREQIAFQMSELNEPTTDWSRIEPVLDEAMESLDPADRTALLLRYFENKSLREVGVAIGASEDAAQKRVSRAIERLRERLSQREVAIGAGGIIALLSANAVQAAPAALAATVASGAIAGSATVLTASTISTSKTILIAMTATQKAIITIAAVGAIAVGVYQATKISKLQGQIESLQQKADDQAATAKQVEVLRRDRDRATNALASAAAESAQKKNPGEVLKLRGEVGRLRQEKDDIASTSGLSKVTENPESRKMLRDQQKMGMGMIYKGFTKTANLSTEQTEKFNDMLADHIMDNVDRVTTALRDKTPVDQLNQVFAGADAALQQKLQTVLGNEGLAQYQDYTKNLLNELTAQQFKGQMTGTDAEKDLKAAQMSQILKESASTALANAGLPADYQTVPMLNFGNIASEQQGDQSLKLLNDIFQSASGRMSSVLSPEELTKFQEFQDTALKNNRAALTLNRNMMAPIAK